VRESIHPKIDDIISVLISHKELSVLESIPQATSLLKDGKNVVRLKKNDDNVQFSWDHDSFDDFAGQIEQMADNPHFFSTDKFTTHLHSISQKIKCKTNDHFEKCQNALSGVQ
jgi:hypothetical protein